MVDWEALQSAFKGVSRVNMLSYCKLIHGLLNTNEQNHKFYGKPNLCPHCGDCPESFLHVATCPHPEVTAYREQQKEILWKKFHSRTPQTLLHYMQCGIISGNPVTSDHPKSIVQSENGSGHSSCIWDGINSSKAAYQNGGRKRFS